jgi:DNA-binding transcriptional ArsR family regulator
MVNSESPSEGELDVVFAALADSSRRTILRRVAARGSLSVGDASADLDLSPAAISKHVKVLEQAGLIVRRLDGRRHILSLESDRLLLAEDWIARYRALWTTSVNRLADLAASLERQPDQPRPMMGDQT